jgi:hypothetical protein
MIGGEHRATPHRDACLRAYQYRHAIARIGGSLHPAKPTGRNGCNNPRCVSRQVMTRRSASQSRCHSAQAQIRGSNPLSPAISRAPQTEHAVRVGTPSRISQSATFGEIRGGLSAEAGPLRIQITEWSGRRGSNSRPLPWQDALRLRAISEFRLALSPRSDPHPCEIATRVEVRMQFAGH